MNSKINIFFAHKSEHKPLLREIIAHLPNYIQPWIDETELCWGEVFENTIENTITFETDFVIVFIDERSLQSTWVLKELNWAANKEIEIHRAFLLPIIIGKIEYKCLPSVISQKQLLHLYEYDKNSISSLSYSMAEKLISLILKNSSVVPLVSHSEATIKTNNMVDKDPINDIIPLRNSIKKTIFHVLSKTYQINLIFILCVFAILITLILNNRKNVYIIQVPLSEPYILNKYDSKKASNIIKGTIDSANLYHDPRNIIRRIN
jgi:hypothetical protein